MFKNIKTLRPYFFSLRELDNNVSLDIKLPVTWKYETIIAPYSTITTKIQDKNERYNLFSLISQATQEGYNVVFTCANEIINVNKEFEEKQKLFQTKVKELEILFQNQSLEKLKDLNFIDNERQENEPGNDLVGEGITERFVGSSDPQEQVN